jgi:small GTP-binding protein
MVGDASVGKTSFLLKTSGDDNTYVAASVNAESFNYERQVDSKTSVSFVVWDTAGQERYHALTNAYLNGATAVIFVFDLGSLESFTGLDYWDEKVTNAIEPRFTVVVGNKCDREQERVVSAQDADTWAENHKATYFEVSAKTGEGTENVILHCAAQVAKVNARNTRLDLPVASERKNRKCSCK